MRRARVILTAVLVVLGLVIVARGLLHLRRGCEAEAYAQHPVISDARLITSAQANYSAVNHDFYEGRIECLGRPTTCIPSYPATGPTFIDSNMAALTTRCGYRRFFYPGPPAGPDEVRRKGASPSSVTCWAYVAVPVSREDGVNTFCVDCTGVVRRWWDGHVPVVKDGRCEEGPELQ